MRIPPGHAAVRRLLALVALTMIAGCASAERTPPPTARPVSSAGAPSPMIGSPAAPTRTESEPPVAAAVRLVIERYDIDLAVVADDLEVEGNRDGFPLCGVAQYLSSYRQPAEAGTTYLYGHAREGMLLPILEAARRNGGRELVGQPILVETADGRRFTYEIDVVRPHATDLSLADDVAPGDRRLVVQTSEGPSGTVPKLQVGAVLVDDTEPDPSRSAKPATPRACPP